MDLADYGIAGDAAELGGDLACRQSLAPKFLQILDAFIRPSHASSLSGEAANWSRQNPPPAQVGALANQTRTPRYR
jgi:hypothetical protein